MSKTGFRLREILLRPNIADQDLENKVRQASKLLEGGTKVRIIVIFRGREMTHVELGLAVLNRVMERLAGVGRVESQPRNERKRLAMTMSPVLRPPEEGAPVGARPKVGPPTLSSAAEAEIPKTEENKGKRS